jgi:Flp pilus assembly protein TadG
MGVRSDHHSSNEHGALLVETALVLSLLLLMVTSVVEVGRYLAIWHGTHTAAREGAGYTVNGDHAGDVPVYADCSEIKWAAASSSGLADLDPAEVEVVHVDRSGARTHTCTDANVDPDPDGIDDGARVVVTVTHEVRGLTPLANAMFGPVSITATDSASIQSSS